MSADVGATEPSGADDAVLDPQAKKPWGALALLSLGVAMIIVDGTVVNVALPSMIKDLDMTFADAEWVNTIYALVFAALLINFGRLADIRGRKLLFLTGIVIFVGASMFAGQSDSASQLIFARLFQGIGAAIILPTTLSSVNTLFTGKSRAIAFAVWGSVIGGMAAIGPLLGGWLTTYHSWRWVFYINLPVGLLVLVLSIFFVPETKDPAARRGADPAGSVLIGAGLAALVFAMIEGQQYGWIQPTAAFSFGALTWPAEAPVSIVPVAFLFSVACLTAFVIIERGRNKADKVVVLDLSLFGLKSFRWGNTTALIVSLGEFGLVFVLPLYLQNVLGFTPIKSGVYLAFIAAGAFLATPLVAKLAQKKGSRFVVMVGMIFEAVSVAGIALVVQPDTGTEIIPLLFTYGIGIGFATAQLTGASLADVPLEESGQGSGTQSTSRQIGSALGIAVLGAVLAVGLGAFTKDQVSQVPGVTAEQADQISQAVRSTGGGAITELRATPGSEAVVAAADEAFVSAMRLTVGIAAIFILFGLLAASRLPPGQLHDPPSEPEKEPVAAGSA
jgi:EmrB/QacA subfamily drug resistance transporter